MSSTFLHALSAYDTPQRILRMVPRSLSLGLLERRSDNGPLTVTSDLGIGRIAANPKTALTEKDIEMNRVE